MGAVLTAVLALAALPGLVGSRTPSPDEQVPAAAFRSVALDASEDGSSPAVRPFDAAFRSAGYMTAQTTLIEPAARQVAPPARPRVRQPTTSAGSAWKAPRYAMSGIATWYDNGTTAMRLPRGTIVVICGAAGCVQRTVTDYGPAGRNSPRIADLMPGDFSAVCGCSLGKGTQLVTVKVY